MKRKPVSAKVVTKGDQRFVVLTYANGDVVKAQSPTGILSRRGVPAAADST